MSRAKVTAISGAYAFDGATYGPFQASKDTPFLEVPTVLADALGLPLHDEELQARAEAAKAEDADIQAVQEGAQSTKLTAALARIAELEAEVQRLTVAQTGSAGDAEPQTATPLPDAFPMAELLRENGFDSLEKVRAGLVQAEGQEKSPIENLSGIGKATLKKIADAAGAPL